MEIIFSVIRQLLAFVRGAIAGTAHGIGLSTSTRLSPTAVFRRYATLKRSQQRHHLDETPAQIDLAHQFSLCLERKADLGRGCHRRDEQLVAR